MSRRPYAHELSRMGLRRVRVGFLCGAKENIGLTEFHCDDAMGVGAAFPPAVVMSACPKCLMGHPTAHRFGSGHAAS